MDHYTKEQLEHVAGKPTIDDGEEWIYVTKVEQNQGIPVDMLFAAYATGEAPVWKTTVVTFDLSGHVSMIATGSVRSRIAEDTRYGYIMGIPILRGDRIRSKPEIKGECLGPAGF